MKLDIESSISPGRNIRNYDIDIDLIDGLQEIPKTTPLRSGLGWSGDESNGEVPELGALTDETIEDIHREWCALYDEMTESE